MAARLAATAEGAEAGADAALAEGCVACAIADDRLKPIRAAAATRKSSLIKVSHDAERHRTGARQASAGWCNGRAERARSRARHRAQRCIKREKVWVAAPDRRS